jgi:ATP-dependent Clp protease ATP-binding subunit ClpC
VDAVTQAVQIAMLGLSDPSRPHAAFLFAGPTGVGKTELARSLAEELFGSDTALVRFDMSEYTEPSSVTRLVGAPPGYVGYDDRALLVDAVREQPFCIILLDEIEKADPRVLDVFLQVLDDGRLTDSKGRTADFRNTLLIMTSNLGAAEAMDDRAGVFGLQPRPSQSEKLDTAVNEAIARHFSPEFLGRLTGCFVFEPLDRATARLIVDKFLERLARQLKSHDVRLDLADDVYDLLLEQGFDVQFGARPLERTIDRLLRAELARLLLTQPAGGGSGAAGRGGVVSVLRDGDRVSMVWDDPGACQSATSGD